MPTTSHATAQTDSDVLRDKRALIMKGGGVKGLAYVGALEELERHYEFNWFIGTSAGAIAAVLLGAGFTTDELKDILQEKEFEDFLDAAWYQKPLNLLFHHGIHRADALTDWLDVLLAKKLNSHDRVRLSQLPKRVTVYASQRGTSALTFDSRDHDSAAAFAARCSMSIPWVFTPQFNQGIRAFDGGIQNNYPVKRLKEDHPRARFISLYLGSEIYEPQATRSVFTELISIASEASDPEMITKYRASTVMIDPSPIGTLDFSLSQEEKELLLLAGRVGALKHLATDGNSNAVLESVVHELNKLRAKFKPAHAAKLRRRSFLNAVKWGVGLTAIAGLFGFFLMTDPEEGTVLFVIIDDTTGDPIFRKVSVRYRVKGKDVRLDFELSNRGRFRIESKPEDIEELDVSMSGYLLNSPGVSRDPTQIIRMNRDQTAFLQSIEPDLDTLLKPSREEYRAAIMGQDASRQARFSVINNSPAAVTPVVMPWMPDNELNELMVLPPCKGDRISQEYEYPFTSPDAYFFVFLSVYGQRSQFMVGGDLQSDLKLTIVVNQVDESNLAEVEIKAVSEWRQSN